MSVNPTDVIAAINSRGRGDPPSAIADIFVNASVRVLQYLDAKNDLGRIRQTVDDILSTLNDSDEVTDLATDLGETEDTITSILSTALDEIASSFGLVRRAAAPSRGSVLLLRNTALVSPITVSSGRRLFAPSLNQEYTVSETIIITSMTYNATLGAFTASVPVQSSAVGLDTVANTQQITRLKDAISGINGVTNLQPVTGGRDEENNESLAARTKIILSANNIGTKSGYTTLVSALDDVHDVEVIGASDPYMLRDSQGGGAVDIYVTDPIPLTVTETTTSDNVDGNDFYPSRQPIINDTTTITVTGFTPGDITITKDDDLFAGSIQGQDYITFENTPPIGTATITYQVNHLVESTQAYMDDPSRRMLGANILVKEAIEILVDVIINIVVESGFNSSEVKTDVETAITAYIASLGIGDDLEQSDVINVITNVDGVDRVDLPPTKFDKQEESGSLNVIEATSREVLRPGVITANL